MSYEEQLQQYVDRETEKFQQRTAGINARVNSLILLHQNIGVIHRYANYEESPLAKPSGSEMSNRRNSWVGKILRVSDVDSGDDIIEYKKNLMREHIGKTVVFNPESAYSLNIKDFPEIWVMHIDGFLCFDEEFKYEEKVIKRIIGEAQLHVKK